MELIEVKDKQRLSREEAADWLRELADQLARNNNVEFTRGDIRFRAQVPDEVELKFEFEIEDGETEVEIELSW